MANELTRKTIRQFVGHISPHRRASERYLVEGAGPTEEGYSLAKAGNWEMAKQKWEQAVRVNPNDFAAHNNLGIYYEAVGQNDQALKAYEQALQRNPTHEDILKNLTDFKANVMKR
jgi:Tfp pilus assembly protein PilF